MDVKTVYPVCHRGNSNLQGFRGNTVGSWYYYFYRMIKKDSEVKCHCCPFGRSGHRILATENYIYCLGGYNPDHSDANNHDVNDDRGDPRLFKELWKFNLSTFKWQLIDDFHSVPPTIASHTVALTGRWLFLFGGTSIPFGETPTHSVYRYDLAASSELPIPHRNNQQRHQVEANLDDEDSLLPPRSKWRLIPVEGQVPDERYGHTMTLKYPDVYIVGGTSGYIYNIDVFHLDLSSPVGKWTRLCWDGDRKQPVGRYRHETAFDGDKLYVFGGGTDRDAFSLKNVHTFNVTTRNWGTLQTFPDPEHGYPKSRKCHSCCQYKKDVFMVGGVSGTTVDGVTAFDDMWRFSLTNATWTKYSVSLPIPLYFHSAEIVPSKGLMYIFGGVTKSRNTDVRTNKMFSIRVAVPELLELVWDNVCAILKNRWDKVDFDELGIPHILQSRIFDV